LSTDKEVILLGSDDNFSLNDIFDSKTKTWLVPSGKSIDYAWKFELSQPSPKFKVAVLDTGIASQHPLIKSVLKKLEKISLKFYD